MEIVWEHGKTTVREMLEFISKKKKKLAYTTVMTVMTRLCEKKMLLRKIDSAGIYIYTPMESKHVFFARFSGNLITSMLKNFGDVTVASFIDILNGNEFKKSEEWRKKLRKIIK